MPSVKLAREGFILGVDVYNAIQSTISGPANESFFVTKPEWAIDFAPNGTLVGLGDRLYRKRLADTLETIANNGPDAFYHGAIAEATIRTINSTGGIMTLSDLANYTAKHRETSQINYRGYKLTSTTAPSSGVVGLAALNAFQLFDDVKTAEDTSDDVGRRTHRLIEATKFAYGMRTELGDPEFLAGLNTYMTGW
jgi:gamma-glutamyltranspeptidase/glutathione hydrolase